MREQGGIRRQVDIDAAGVGHLRDQAESAMVGRVAMAETAGLAARARSCSSASKPVAIQWRCHSARAASPMPMRLADGAARADCSADGCRRPSPARSRARGRGRRRPAAAAAAAGMHLVQIFHDGQRLGHDMAVMDERGIRSCGFSACTPALCCSPSLRRWMKRNSGTMSFRFSAMRTRKAAEERK